MFQALLGTFRREASGFFFCWLFCFLRPDSSCCSATASSSSGAAVSPAAASCCSSSSAATAGDGDFFVRWRSSFARSASAAEWLRLSEWAGDSFESPRRSIGVGERECERERERELAGGERERERARCSPEAAAGVGVGVREPEWREACEWWL